MSSAVAMPPAPATDAEILKPAPDTLDKPSLTSSYTSAAFDALRDDFHSLLSELWSDRSSASFDRFRAEFDKLLAVIRKHQENEKKLIGKCRELNTEIVNNAAKIQTALRLSFQDQANISSLKDEVDKAWKAVDTANDRDKKNRELIEQLKQEIVTLQSDVTATSGQSQLVSAEKAELLAKQAALSAEFESLTTKCAEQLARIDELNISVQSSESDRMKKDKEILALKEKFAAQKTEVQRHARKCERLQSEIVSMKESHDKRQHAAHEREKELNEVKNKRDELVTELSSLNSSLTQVQHENTELRTRREEDEKLIYLYKQKEMDLYSIKEQLTNETRALLSNIKNREHEITALNKKLTVVEKDKAQLASARTEAERYKAWIADEMRTVLKHMARYKVEAENDERLIRELQQQIKKLQNGLQQTQEKSLAQSTMAAQGDAIRKQLELDLASVKNIEHDLRIQSFALEKEKEREAIKCQSWFARYREKEELLKLKDMEIHELQKQLKEEKAKLRLQQTLYEQVRNDRNLFSRAQINSEDEINEMRRKFKIMVHQIEQLKEEIGTKDAALINEHFVLKRLTEELKLCKRKLSKRAELMARADDIMAAQQLEIRNLRKVLVKSQQTQAVQQRQFEDLITERDLIGCQLIRRNDELALLYEKVRIQASVLAKGEAQYRARVSELQTAKAATQEVERRLGIKIEESRGIEAMKTEIRSLQKELTSERSKVKALSEELENPINVHRWRQLEGADPHKFDLLQKIQTLQKRLIAQTEQTVEAQHLAKEKDSLYAAAKAALARAPGPEVHELLSKYERSDRDKSKQMRAMCAELNALNVKCERLAFECTKLEQDKQEMKKRVNEMARKASAAGGSSKEKDEERKEQTTLLPATLHASDPFLAHQERFFSSAPRMTGGGFKIE